MMQALTRRSLVVAVPAGVIAAAAPALAAEQPDAALLALRESYERSLVVMAAASKPHSRAEEAYYVLKTERPELDERALRKASGLIIAERVWVKAVSANVAVILDIAEQPARTIAGLAFKARVSARADNFEPDLVTSIIDDLITLGGSNA